MPGTVCAGHYYSCQFAYLPVKGATAHIKIQVLSIELAASSSSYLTDGKIVSGAPVISNTFFVKICHEIVVIKIWNKDCTP